MLGIRWRPCKISRKGNPLVGTLTTRGVGETGKLNGRIFGKGAVQRPKFVHKRRYYVRPGAELNTMLTTSTDPNPNPNRHRRPVLTLGYSNYLRPIVVVWIWDAKPNLYRIFNDLLTMAIVWGLGIFADTLSFLRRNRRHMFSRFATAHDCDGQTDGQTDKRTSRRWQ